jgi:hypothetical protein
MSARFRHRYGAGPWHLAGHLLAFGVAGFALDQIFSGGQVLQLLEWYVGFALLQDLVLIPLYSGADRLARRLSGARQERRPALVNHIRAPALISGVLLLVYAPLITGVGGRTYFFYSGHHVDGYLRNWLLVTVFLFLASGVLYAIRAWRQRAAI